MFAQSPCEYYRPMSFQQGSGHPDDEMDPYYGGYNSQWPSSYVGNPYNAPAPYQNQVILTPISLPDNSYAHTRTSPVVSHHSQEYQYPVSDSFANQGLGITTSLPSELVQDPGFHHGIAPTGYAPREETHSPQPPPKRRTRRGSRQSTTRGAPVSIAPDPEGLQRLEEQQRQQNYAELNPQRARASGRRGRSQQAEEEDQFVARLRARQVPWKEVVRQFTEKFGKVIESEATLQMRLNRWVKAREARGWEEHDVQLLLRARDLWQQEKYKFIAQKMTEFGATNTFTPEQCEARLDYIEAQERERAEQNRNNNNQQLQTTNESRRKRRRADSTQESGHTPLQSNQRASKGRKKPRSTTENR
ncbi:uncharacterized protein BDV17DRAFT_181706 [Aspergillus undulatus]|uniref:uncharacterized protein n=1 Tax=Aspergillus undulatus TaxID=1810928 RepID=UPI003CCCD61B